MWPQFVNQKGLIIIFSCSGCGKSDDWKWNSQWLYVHFCILHVRVYVLRRRISVSLRLAYPNRIHIFFKIHFYFTLSNTFFRILFFLAYACVGKPFLLFAVSISFPLSLNAINMSIIYCKKYMYFTYGVEFLVILACYLFLFCCILFLALSLSLLHTIWTHKKAESTQLAAEEFFRMPPKRGDGAGGRQAPKNGNDKKN